MRLKFYPLHLMCGFGEDVFSNISDHILLRMVIENTPEPKEIHETCMYITF